MSQRAKPRPRASGHRDALLEGAIACIRRDGYARTTARAVVAESQTNLGSIAYHFGTIERLRDEALVEAGRRWLGPIVDLARSGRGPSTEAALEAFLSSLDGERLVVLGFLEALAQAPRKPAVRRRLARGYAELRAALGALAPATAGAETTASLAIAVCDGLMIQWLLDPGAIAREELPRQIASILRLP